jgi:hypothetical protein
MAKTTKARKAYQAAKKKPLGSGARFKAIEAEAKAGGAKDPGAVAAAAGRKAHGQKAMTKYAQQGKKRKKKG